MTSHKHAPRLRAGLMARLLGGASMAVIASYTPALAQDLNITIDSAQGAPDSAFTAANVTGFETVANNTQDSRAAVSASIAGGELNSDIAGSGSSAVGIEDNALTATATGNVFTLDADQLGSSGDGSAGTLAALSGQFADGTVSTAITDSSLTIDGTGDAASTSLAASDNTVSATTTVNNATSVFSDDISADLAGDLAQSGTGFITGPIALTRDNLVSTETLSIDGGSSVLASTQALTGGALSSSATIDDSAISVSLAANDSTDSAVSVDGNELRSTLSGNTATTATDVTVDTAFDGSAGVFTQQQIGDGNVSGLTAATTDSSLSVTLADSTASSLTVSDNVLGASVRGNVATLDGDGVAGNLADGTSLSISANSITSDANGGQIDIDNTAGTVGFADATAPTNATNFGFVAASQQSIDGSVSGAITANNNGSSLTVDASGALDGSSLAVRENTAFAIASSNTGGTAIDLNATRITASAGLALDQNVSETDVFANLGNTGAFILSADVNGDLSDSALAVDANLSVAEANGNTGRALLSADADTALLSSSTLDTGSSVVDTALATSATEADFAVAANQSTGADAITATATSALDATVGNAVGSGLISNSSVSLSSNVQQATAGGNTLTNGIDLDGNVIGQANATFAEGVSVVTSLTSLQDSASTITGTSTTTLSLTQEGLNGTLVSGSSLDVDGNENRATASANRATSTLAVTADTAIIGADVTAASADFASDTSITTVGGTNSLANVQDSSGAIGATTTTDADVTVGGFGGGNGASLTGSSASISDNIVTASGSANIGTSTIDIDGGTGTTINAALANVQRSTSVVTAGATFDAGDDTGSPGQGILLEGRLVNSTLGIDDNVIVSSGMGNQGTSTLSVAANTIDRTESTVTASSAVSAATPDVDADFASLNVQDQTGDITSGATSGGTVLLSEVPTFPGSGTITDSSVTLNENQLQSDAISNLATNSIDLTGTSDITATTVGLGSVQTSGGINVTSDADATFLAQTENSAVTDSTVSIDGNQSFDSATSNRVTNTIALAGNAITGQATTLSDVGITLEPQVLATADADNSLPSVQTSFAAVDSGSSITGTISTGTGRLLGSNASVSDNFARSFGIGNTGVNTLGLLADTSFVGTSALTGTQVQEGNVASSTSVTAPITVVALAASAAEIDENIAFSRSMGNDQTNALSIEGSSIAGVSVATISAEFTALGDAPATRTLEADNVVTAFQGLSNGDVTGAATVDGTVDTAGFITDSSVSASDNIAQSNVTGSRGNNLLELAADTTVTGVSVLTSEQSSLADNNETNVVSSNADLTFDIDQTGEFAPINSALTVDGNVGFSSAFGNDVTNRLDVSGTSVVGQDDVLSSADVTAAGVVSGTSDNLLGNFQSRSVVTSGDDNAVTSSADLTVNLLNSASGATTNSTISASDNILDSTATSNRAFNALVLNAETALTAGGAIANQQTSDSPVTSNVALRTSVGNVDLGDLNGSSAAMRDNTGVARAAGNDAANVLNASAGTVITGVAGSGSSGVTAGALNAEGTFSTASNQVNSGAVTARASFGTGSNVSSLGVQTAALNNSSVDLSGNRLVADAVSNRVSNTISVSGRSPSANVTTALTSRQVATGAVEARVDTFNVASSNGALDGSSVGMSGNTFSASAGGNIATNRLVRD